MGSMGLVATMGRLVCSDTCEVSGIQITAPLYGFLVRVFSRTRGDIVTTAVMCHGIDHVCLFALGVQCNYTFSWSLHVTCQRSHTSGSQNRLFTWISQLCVQHRVVISSSVLPVTDTSPSLVVYEKSPSHPERALDTWR
jgi:hypothetical protein